MTFKFVFSVSVFLLITFSTLFAQREIETKNLRSKFAKKENRIKFEQQINQLIDTSFSKPISKLNSKQWHKAFNDASLYFIKKDTIEHSLDYVFDNYKIVNDKLLYRSIQTAYTLYPDKFHLQIENIFNETNNPSIFSASALYILNIKGIEYIKVSLRTKFLNYKLEPILKFFDFYLESKLNPIPPLGDLFKHNFQSGKTIVYSIQRKDRRYTGLTIIRSPDGRFVRNNDGTIFNIPHLALSVSNFPGILKNGNTPQGIYSIQKFYYTPTESIGPSPILLSRIPFEIDAKIFFHGTIKYNNYKIEDYRNLLPNTWQEYLPIYESYYAGQSGRRLIVAHGSADDPNYYLDKIYSPFAPTKGCLSAKEIWDQKGKLVESDQIKLMNAFFSTRQLYGFLVVIEIDDKMKPVQLEDILRYIEQ